MKALVLSHFGFCFPTETEIKYHSGDFSCFLLDMPLIKCKCSLKYSSGLLSELTVKAGITVS
jgi:hypothetical protein